MKLCDFCKSGNNVSGFKVIFGVESVPGFFHEESVIIGEVCRNCKPIIQKKLDIFIMDLIKKVRVKIGRIKDER